MTTSSLALALALVTAIPTLAHAADVDDSVVEHELTAPRAPSAYLQLGSTLGTDDDGMWLAATVEGGLRLAHTPLWAHGQVAFGSAEELFVWDDGDRGRFTSARGGLEARATVPYTDGLVGVYAGIDIGYRSLGYGDPMSSSSGTAIAVARLGFDVGGTHLRVRPGLDGTTDGLALNAALAYQW